jgi:hypothetical protein
VPRLLLCVYRREQPEEQIAVDFGMPVPIGEREVDLRKAQGGYDIVLTRGDALVGFVPLHLGVPRRLELGDEVALGSAVAVLKLDAGEDVRTFELALGLVDAAVAPKGPYVHVVEGAARGETLPLTAEGKPYRLGRDQESALDLGDPSLSRTHLAITRKGQRVVVRDLESKAGSFYGKVRLAPGRDAEWQAGRHLKIGDTVLALRGIEAPGALVANLPPSAPSEAPREQVSASLAARAVVPPAPAAPKPPQRDFSHVLSRVVMVGGGLIVVGCLVLLGWLLLFSGR